MFYKSNLYGGELSLHGEEIIDRSVKFSLLVSVGQVQYRIRS